MDQWVRSVLTYRNSLKLEIVACDFGTICCSYTANALSSACA